MKKIYLLATAVAIGSAAMAQVDSAASTTVVPSDDGKSLPYRKSVAVKFNPASLVFGKVQLGGEWNYKKKRSVTFYAGIPIDQSAPAIVQEKLFNQEDQTIRDFKIKTMSAMVGYRVYMGKREMTGFYFEPYLKYLKNDIAAVYEHKTSTKSSLFALSSETSTFSVGAQLGLQFMIAKRVTFDMFILGPEANMAKNKVTIQDIGSIVPWDAADEAEAQRELEDVVKEIPVIGDKINVKVDKDQKRVTSDFSGFLPGFRGGISVGIRL